MIVKMSGIISKFNDGSLYLDHNGIVYEIFVSPSHLERLRARAVDSAVTLSIYHCIQGSPGGSNFMPVLIGFQNELDKSFFEKIISVSGIGPRQAIKSLSVPISEIASAIENEDIAFLKRLPGLGPQKAKNIIAKLKGKVGIFAL